MKVAAITSVLSAILMGFFLKTLKFFHLIDWSPVGFYKKTELFADSSKLLQWTYLIIILFGIAIILYLLTQYLYFIPAVLTSFVIGLVIAMPLEWHVLDLPMQLSSFKKLSIPFMVTVICMLRFIIETAVFHKKEHTSLQGNS